MTPNNFKIAIRHVDGMTLFLITTSDHKFIARACMRDMQNNDGFDVMLAVARPTFGTLLYQSMAKYASILGKGIASSRDGCTEHASINIWKTFNKTISPNNKTKLPNTLNEHVINDLSPSESEAFTYSYSIPASDAFISSLVFLGDNNNTNEAAAMREVMSASRSYFTTSYYAKGSAWINESLSLESDETTTLTTRKYPVGNILIDKGTFLSTLRDIRDGHVSRSPGPIECVIDIDGDLVFFDGHHRYIESILKGDTHVSICVVHSEYTHGFISDVERPNKADLISLADIYAYCNKPHSHTCA